ncbi:MAG TPA: HAD hydrolase family protein [Gemmatimonadaceae bacterium]|jgi:mannosyl-3-phosphoglycerate phosphatase|nr:HAD hydrolase family protein [Gemmatimonadota bacterium]MBK9411760.1 HAD hydrolase family protein [Gemmatimonadota bacterium]MBP9105227.1 HAD hydrolase family protein [Gemmatimonadaceae bacterium]HNV73167.1 HAD hydrolase family protein [Gemmatimonadaceae bacterium]HPV73777.1 HAD hydrolase family protein [Gemmatimonadaceae bacterium]
MRSILLLSDVDGTLLDRAGQYAIGAGELRAAGTRVTLVLVSSRTVLELSQNQRALGLQGPVVAENGAVVAWPWHESLRTYGTQEEIDGCTWCVRHVGRPASEIREASRSAAHAAGVAYVDQADVEPTLGRRCSVLLRPVPGASDASLAPLAQALRVNGWTVASGGAWLAVTGDADKGRGVVVLQSALTGLGQRYDITAAVGDGDNDVSLLLAADRRFVIGRDDGTWHPSLRALPDAECVPTPGIAGWREVLRQLTALQEV